MVSALDRKLLRDVSRLRGQVLTIAVVVACGIASYTTISGTYRALLSARDAYYARYHFPDLFCHLKRAPRSLEPRLAQLAGVARVSTRLREAVTLPMPGQLSTLSGTLLSAPPPGRAVPGDVLVRSGRLPSAADEVLLLEAFFDAHQLELGDRIPVVVNGQQRMLSIVGTAITPEVIFAVAPGELVPDPLRYAVLWMERRHLADLLQMGGAFNEVVFEALPTDVWAGKTSLRAEWLPSVAWAVPG